MQEEKYTLRSKFTKENLYIEGYGKHWGEKMTFTIGVSYCMTAVVGFFMGFRSTAVIGDELGENRRVLSRCVLSANRFGIGGASASFLYCVTGKMIDLLFEEEIKDYGKTARNALSGVVTGAIYKSTLGLKPMLFASVLGGVFITGLTYSMNFLSDKGLINFRVYV
jgi:mitochondrial import inner membrane translocase subunit TIM23